MKKFKRKKTLLEFSTKSHEKWQHWKSMKVAKKNVEKYQIAIFQRPYLEIFSILGSLWNWFFDPVSEMRGGRGEEEHNQPDPYYLGHHEST